MRGAVPLLLTLGGAAHAGPAGAPDLEGTGQAPIVGGSEVPAGKWPDAVAVLGAQGSCTGTLVAPTVVLTAGHCAEANPTRVIANTTNYNATGGTSANVKLVVAYPQWQTTYDVSIIILATPITTVQPRKVGTECTLIKVGNGTQVHLVGFGSTDTAGTAPNTRLLEAMAPVTDPDCINGNGCMAGVSPGGEFVAGGTGTDTCFGDSGGPVYFDTPRGPVVIAAVSRGVDNSPTPCGGGGIYVRTDKIVDWIEQTAKTTIAKDLCDATPPEGGGNDPTQPERGELEGGCSTGRGSLVLALLALPLVLRRRCGLPARAASP